MRQLIALAGAVFVILGGIFFVLGMAFLLYGMAEGATAMGAALMLPTLFGSCSIILVGGLTWVATQQDKRLERIEALIAANVARVPPAAAPPASSSNALFADDYSTHTPPRTIVLGEGKPAPMPGSMPPLPAVGTPTAAGWYWRMQGPARIWHPGGPISAEAHTL